MTYSRIMMREPHLTLYIYLDFGKAFDTVHYKYLLIKLKAQGMGEHLCVRAESWLRRRKRSVDINGEEASD